MFATAFTPRTVADDEPVTASGKGDIFAAQKAADDAILDEIGKLELELKAKPGDSAIRRKIGVLYSLSSSSTEKAQPIFEELAKERECTDTLMDLAACHYKKDFDEAYRLCLKAQRYNNGVEYTPAMVELGMARCCYRKNDMKQSEALHQSSLDKLSDKDRALVPRLDLDGLATIYARYGDYDKSIALFEELYRLDRDNYGAKDIECGWTLLQLSEVLSYAKKEELAAACWNRSIWLFRKVNVDRLIEEYKASHNGLISEQIRQSILQRVYGLGLHEPPDPFSEDHSKYLKYVSERSGDFISPWKRKFKQTEAPGWVWMDPVTPVKAIVICVHGLGLHHRSFESFAQRISREGFTTIAFDVRGFDTYMDANGHETLKMQECVNDLKMVISQLRKDYAKLPIFILGESMGGALALRVVAEKPEIVDGLICSVPSGDRYESLGTKLKIGADFLTDKVKPVAIGANVVNRATSSESLRKGWTNDPSSRLNLSAEELLNFQRFMNENSRVAKQIKDKPVILFQGHNDKLVKETGTLDLFDALGTPDKTMVLIGNTEHLIFEAGQFKDDVALGVLGWMTAHFPKRDQSTSTVVPAPKDDSQSE